MTGRGATERAVVDATLPWHASDRLSATDRRGTACRALARRLNIGPFANRQPRHTSRVNG